MNQAPDKTVPVLVGGVLLGVLSAIPIVNFVNCACCAWVITGGIVAVYLYVKNYPAGLPPITYGDGALLGVLAGVIGAIISTIIELPFKFLFATSLGGWHDEISDVLQSNPDVPEEVRALVESLLAGGVSVGMVFVELLFGLVIFSIFGAIGGILGVAFFQGRTAPPVYPGSSGYQPPQPGYTPAAPTSPAAPSAPETPPAPPSLDEQNKEGGE